MGFSPYERYFGSFYGFLSPFHVFEPFRGCGGKMRVVKWMSLGGVGHVELTEGFLG